MAYAQEETQGLGGCEVTDDPVVVSKVGPVKASNGVEEKTRLTTSIVSDGVHLGQKPV